MREISRFFVAPLCEFLLSVYAPTPYPKISTPEYSQSELSKIELVFLAATPSFPCKPCGGEAVSLESRSDVAFPSLPRDFEGYWHKLTSPQPEKRTCKKTFPLNNFHGCVKVGTGNKPEWKWEWEEEEEEEDWLWGLP